MATTRPTTATPWWPGGRRNSGAWPPRTPEEQAIDERAKIEAACEGQIITLTGQVPAVIDLRLSDALLDLDRPVTVRVNGREVFTGTVQRTAAAIAGSIQERLDAESAATALVRLN